MSSAVRIENPNINSDDLQADGHAARARAVGIGLDAFAVTIVTN
jgi:hypothetical protein